MTSDVQTKIRTSLQRQHLPLRADQPVHARDVADEITDMVTHSEAHGVDDGTAFNRRKKSTNHDPQLPGGVLHSSPRCRRGQLKADLATPTVPSWITRRHYRVLLRW